MTEVADWVSADTGLGGAGPLPGTPDAEVEKRSRQRGRRPLRALLVATDVGVVAATWLVILFSLHHDDWEWIGTRAVPFSLLMGAITFLLAWSQKLYQARVCALRSAEITRLSRVAVLAGLVAFGIGRYSHILKPWVVLAGAAAAFVTAAAGRSVYGSWLRLSRAQGHFARPVCVVGTNDEAEELVHLLRDHPDLGYRVTAVIGDPVEWAGRVAGLPVVRMGPDPAATVRQTGAVGAVVTATGLIASGRDRLIGRLMAEGIHVQLSAGLSRLGHHRMRVSPLAHQLTFYVEPPQLSGGQAAMKRILDVVVASALLVLTAPIVAVAALVIHFEDGGPVLYRQERVGLGGRTFRVLKLRTMVPDAAVRLAELKALNERQGPLFKVTADPRVTRVGRFLRTSSIDELPQLINVLRGEMSLVGPRPALPAEFAQFDADLVERAQVLPGVTGLWQVEARDNPSFRAYRRLDLFYVDNWSLAFDLAIMAGTARMLMIRTFTAGMAVLRHRFHHHLAPTPPASVGGEPEASEHAGTPPGLMPQTGLIPQAGLLPQAEGGAG